MLHPTTLNNCSYVECKLINMVHDFWTENKTCPLIKNSHDAEEVESLIDKLQAVISTGIANDAAQWNAVKIAKYLASEFRTAKTIESEVK